MSKYELSVSKDYVPDWGVVEAIRELFQNALDQQTSVEGNTMFFYYDALAQVLSIGNKLSTLDTKTLLLGSSTKREDDKTIGQFGEGYKIATLVLSRMDKKVTFYNYGKREVWRPRFVNSRRYGAEVLTFFVDKKFVWSKVPDDNLTITVENFTQEDYNKVFDSNLHLNMPNPSRVFEGEKGQVLLEPQYSKKVFVNGLYVTEYSEYTYGYNFKPGVLKLDRDRKLVSDFDLKWLSSRIWSDQTSDAMQEEASRLASEGSADVQFLTSSATSTENVEKIAEKTHARFIQQHGENAVPVVAFSTEEYPADAKKIAVTNSIKDLIELSPGYVTRAIQVKPVHERLRDWITEYGQNLSEEAIEEFNQILSQEEMPF